MTHFDVLFPEFQIRFYTGKKSAQLKLDWSAGSVNKCINVEYWRVIGLVTVTLESGEKITFSNTPYRLIEYTEPEN